MGGLSELILARKVNKHALAKRTSVYLQKATTLKVPKREIFDRSDFPDFYTMKSLPVGDFGV